MHRQMKEKSGKLDWCLVGILLWSGLEMRLSLLISIDVNFYLVSELKSRKYQKRRLTTLKYGRQTVLPSKVNKTERKTLHDDDDHCLNRERSSFPKNLSEKNERRIIEKERTEDPKQWVSSFSLIMIQNKFCLTMSPNEHFDQVTKRSTTTETEDMKQKSSTKLRE